MSNDRFFALTDESRKKVDGLNLKWGYGISTFALILLVRRHEKARKENNEKEMLMIEYRLTSINFHYECGLLVNAEYDTLLKKLKDKYKGERNGNKN